MKKISFIIIAFNEEKTIARCIKSIMKQKNLFDYEIIVVNDSSTDSTIKVVSKFVKINKRIKLHSLLTNQGRGAARNTGINASIGEYVAFIDADIILPQNWLITCMSYMDRYDAVSGIAVPDGDVNYIYVKCKLNPKIVSHSTIITGNNGLYNRKIFGSVMFDKSYKNGEDFVFNHYLKKKKYKIYSITSLVVEHRESKDFIKELKWLYQSGLGASRLFKQFGKLRLPDITFFCLLIIVVLTTLLNYILHLYILILFLPLYVLFISTIHLIKKFHFQFNKSISFTIAILLNSILLASYYWGRFIGIFTEKKSRFSN